VIIISCDKRVHTGSYWGLKTERQRQEVSEESGRDVTRNEAPMDADGAPDSLVKEAEQEPEDLTSLLTVLQSFNDENGQN
jgi:hypothetical protein